MKTYKDYFPELASSDPEIEKTVRDQFHLMDKERGRVTGVYDYQIFAFIKFQKPMFILGGTPFIYDGSSYQQDRHGAELKTMIRTLIYPQFVKSGTIKRIYDLFLSDAELQREFSELNAYPAHWIAFKNGFFDVKSKTMHSHDPKYLLINIIPHEYEPKAKTTGAHLEEWFSFILPDKQDREMLLEYFGYCMTRDIGQQKFLILCGDGGTGKSTLIKLLETVIGTNNTASVPLEGLTQRFYSFELLGKLLNSCADVSTDNLTDTSQLKKLLGEDLCLGERKGQDPIFFRSYAKMVFSANELPLIQGEHTCGFYRRLLVLTMDKKPQTTRPDFFSTLELDYFVSLCVDALGRMLQAGTIQESENSKNAVAQLRSDSDSVDAFITEKLVSCYAEKIKQGDMYELYEKYCLVNDRTPYKKRSFNKALRSRGFTVKKSHGVDYYLHYAEKTTLDEVPFDTD